MAFPQAARRRDRRRRGFPAHPPQGFGVRFVQLHPNQRACGDGPLAAKQRLQPPQRLPQSVCPATGEAPAGLAPGHVRRDLAHRCCWEVGRVREHHGGRPTSQRAQRWLQQLIKGPARVPLHGGHRASHAQPGRVGCCQPHAVSVDVQQHGAAAAHPPEPRTGQGCQSDHAGSRPQIEQGCWGRCAGASALTRRPGAAEASAAGGGGRSGAANPLAATSLPPLGAGCPGQRRGEGPARADQAPPGRALAERGGSAQRLGQVLNRRGARRAVPSKQQLAAYGCKVLRLRPRAEHAAPEQHVPQRAKVPRAESVLHAQVVHANAPRRPQSRAKHTHGHTPRPSAQVLDRAGAGRLLVAGAMQKRLIGRPLRRRGGSPQCPSEDI
mmetsp:Transcript_9650/g.37561  ORF Transcript_9650/g.37561 Transcript_9650/m.37561 type:complete len:382 (-) Transcript_9650:209-1354(-)